MNVVDTVEWRFLLFWDLVLIFFYYTPSRFFLFFSFLEAKCLTLIHCGRPAATLCIH